MINAIKIITILRAFYLEKRLAESDVFFNLRYFVRKQRNYKVTKRLGYAT